jgi:hypothetical protein
MNDPITNLQPLRRSRKKPEVGDVFAMLLPDEQFLFGRVIRIDVLPPMSANLIYVYSSRSSEKAEPDDLRPDRLLLPPAITNNLGWSRGRFETVARRPLAAGDVLETHCFRRQNAYVDEYRNLLPARVEPCGISALKSYRMLDDEISDALGIPCVPVEPDDR